MDEVTARSESKGEHEPLSEGDPRSTLAVDLREYLDSVDPRADDEAVPSEGSPAVGLPRARLDLEIRTAGAPVEFVADHDFEEAAQLHRRTSTPTIGSSMLGAPTTERAGMATSLTR